MTFDIKEEVTVQSSDTNTISHGNDVVRIPPRQTVPVIRGSNVATDAKKDID